MSPERLAELLGRWSAGRGPLYLLLATQLRQLIDEGRCPPGTKLPPDRVLATTLAVGRNTVVAAYDQLREQGRVVRRQGSGTEVAPGTLRGHRTLTSDTTNPLFLNLLAPPDGSVAMFCAAPIEPPPTLIEAYAAALPELTALRGDMGYHPAGVPALRAALAEYYCGRGVPTSPDQIMITAGAQQAVSLLVRLFVTPGDRVLVEAPTYPGVVEPMREAAAVIRTVAVGPGGLDVPATLRGLRDRPALAYLVPTHHNPTGTVVPALVRPRLVEAAEEAGVPLVEDEALANLPLTDAPTPPPLALHSPDGGVISVGSLSKLVWGGLRIGWIRAQAPVVDRLSRLKAIHDLGGAVLDQLAAAKLVPQIPELVARKSQLATERSALLAEQLRTKLPEWTWQSPLGGQVLWVRLPHGNAEVFTQVALRHGVAVLSGNCLDVTSSSDAYLRLPFLADPDELVTAVDGLAAAWAAYRGERAEEQFASA